MTTKNTEQTKQKKVSEKTPETTITVKQLASRIGIEPKKLRQILRAEFPRESKGKKWQITQTLAKKVESGYKAKIKAKENEKKLKAIDDTKHNGENSNQGKQPEVKVSL